GGNPDGFGSITNVNLRNSGFSGTAGQTYTLRWTISNGVCTSSFDDVQIAFLQNPVIGTQPVTQTVCEGSNVTFSVSATGSGLTYQWKKGGVDIGGATASTLTLNNVAAANAGSYTVLVKGTCDAVGVLSAAAILTINEQPEITVQPSNSTICENGNTTFTVNAGVTTVPTYQWQVSTNGGVSYSNLANGGI